MRRLIIVLCLLGIVAFGACQWLLPERFAVNAPMAHTLFGFGGKDAPAVEVIDDRMQVTEGFEVGIYADGLDRARGLLFTPSGDLLVSRPHAGSVILLEADRNGDGRADGQRLLLEGLNRPHGMDLHDGFLYIAETDGFGRVAFEAGDGPGEGQIIGDYERLVDGLPADGNHWSRTLRFGPDGLVYVSVGSSCNVCIEDEPNRRAAMLRFQPDGSGEQTFATGLRNTVGFDWRPSTGQLYGTDNGRDLLGDDFPPCEFNQIVEGGFYGWPYANGDRVPDPTYGKGEDTRIAASVPPAHGFEAHNAPLGMAFVTDLGEFSDGSDVAIAALHGSWNRRSKDGYKVVSLHFGPDGEIEERDFLTGFLKDEDVIGRPVDVAQGPDGAVYISDDYSNSVWRVNLAGQGAAAAPIVVTRRTASTTPLSHFSASDIGSLSARGQELYDQNNCAACHEVEKAEAGVVAKPLDDLLGRYEVADLEVLLETPPSPMPIVDLGSEDRKALAVYLLSAKH